MYGEAFRAALEWQEMLYRIRRRENTNEAAHAVITRFHDLQERLNYYEGWIGSESKYMRRSYRRLVDSQKREMKNYIQDAWSKPGTTGNAQDDDRYPDAAILTDAADLFLRDVRNHLSIQPWRWLIVVFRNQVNK